MGLAPFLTVAWADRNPGAGPKQLRVNHLGLMCDDGGQDFLLFALRHIEGVERAGDLRTHLVDSSEVMRRSLWASCSSFPVYGKGPPATAQSDSVRMNFRPGNKPFPFHSLSCGFTLSFGFSTILSLKRSTTMAMALTPPSRSYRLCSVIVTLLLLASRSTRSGPVPAAVSGRASGPGRGSPRRGSPPARCWPVAPRRWCAR